MARISTIVSLLALTATLAVLLIPRDGAADRHASFAASEVDRMPVGSTGDAKRAKRMRDTLAP